MTGEIADFAQGRHSLGRRFPTHGVSSRIMVDRHVRVLLIEDSHVDQTLIVGQLHRVARVRFEVAIVELLRDGLAAIDRAPPDAVLLDLSLSDSYGVDTCRQVVAAAPEIPLVVLTGLDHEETAIESLQIGAQDYLVKGQFDGNLISRSLLYAMERKRNELTLQRANNELELRVEERTAELLQEIEERKRIEEHAQRQQEELKHVARLNTLGEMASGLAHELNQPLMAITGFADAGLQHLAVPQGDSPVLRPILEDIAAEAHRAGEIIKRLRRLVAKRPSQHSDTSLNEVIHDTIPLFLPELKQGRMELRLELAEHLPVVKADRIQIQQVILNLAHNALQAMKSAERANHELTISTRFDTVHGCVETRVADTGPGASAEVLEHVFDPFFTTRAEGMGLGLSVSRSIVEAHAGRMTVAPSPGGGLVFMFTLPARTGGVSGPSAAGSMV